MYSTKNLYQKLNFQTLYNYEFDPWYTISQREFKDPIYPDSYMEFHYDNPCLIIYVVGIAFYLLFSIINTLRLYIV